jgi:membrane protease YdiL (CAAX protease family)
MSDAVAVPAPEPAALPPRRGLAWLAWVVIVLLVGFEVLWPHFRPSRRGRRDDAARRVMADVQVRQTVGFAELFRQREQFYAEAKKSLDTGPVADRLRFVVLAGDLEGPDEALAAIGRLDEEMAGQHVEPDADQQAVLEALTRLYRDRKDGTHTLTDDDRDLLRAQLGWSGRLALTPPDDPDTAARAAVIDPARRLARTFAAVLGGGLLLAVIGMVALMIWFAFFLTGLMGPTLPADTRRGRIYAEAFAVYMLVYFALGIAGAFVPVPASAVLLANCVAMLLALAAGVGWPVLRRVPWRQVRQDVGLTLGRHPLLQPLIGLVGYVLVLPVFGLGLIVSIALISMERRLQVGEHPEQRFTPVEQPTHPIVEWLEHPDWGLLLQVLLIACVLAPLVEETMFRGVLYRHLRDATSRLGRAGSFLVSATIVSFVFAVIHPQGLLAVPVLMGLAFGLNLLREWRGSLVPSMMVHGVHNGLTTYLLLQALRG